jgi:hypothetical protein
MSVGKLLMQHVFFRVCVLSSVCLIVCALQFYPASHITVAYSVIEASIAVSQIIAAPVAAGLLQLSGVWGLAG